VFVETLDRGATASIRYTGAGGDSPELDHYTFPDAGGTSKALTMVYKLPAGMGTQYNKVLLTVTTGNVGGTDQKQVCWRGCTLSY
jgi:hypothetical protein